MWVLCCRDAGKPVWEIMLKPYEVWYQLAAIHSRLTAACASPHKFMALGGISVLMRLLEVWQPLTRSSAPWARSALEFLAIELLP